MGLRFIHAADVHLGYEQYGNAERYNDFYRALKWLADEVVSQEVDYLLLAGDLFNKFAIDPRTLYHATHELERLRNAGIRVLAIQGNHERPHYLDKFSWLEYLARMGLLTLLSTTYQDNTLALVPVAPGEHRGSYVDLPGGVRVLGLPYSGASTSRLVADLAEALPALPGPRPAYTVLMLHAGIEGVLPNYSGGLTRAQLAPLRPHVDYVAFGHIHKPFEQDDWLYNPGSLETTTTLEAPWTDRGCLLVEVDAAAPGRHHVTRLVNPRRPFRQIALEVDALLAPEMLYATLQQRLSREQPATEPTERPVALLRLRGVLPFPRLELEPARLETIVVQALNPLHFELRDESSAPGDIATLQTGLSPADLERQVLSELVERDVRYLGQGQHWAEMVIHVKQMALARSAPERIVDELRAFRRESSAEEAPC